MSIRARIAILSAFLTAIILAGIGIGVYFTLQRSINQEIDNRLRSVFVGVATRSSGELSLATGQLTGVYIPDLDPFASPGLYVQVTNTDGTGYKNSTPSTPNVFMPIPSGVLRQNQKGNVQYYTTSFHEVPVRVLSAPLVTPSGQVAGMVQTVQPLTATQKTMQTLRLLFLAGLGFGLVAAALGAYVLSGRSLRPLSRITNTARGIGRSRDLSDRIELPRTGDEVQDLAETFNAMLDRLDEAFTAERRFVSDASHELRTPLTALRGNAEILLRQIEMGAVEKEDAIEILSDIRDESERMGRLVQNLLTLARADVGWTPELELVPLDQIASDASRLAVRLAGKHEFSFDIDEEVDVIGNSDQLKQLLLILLDNAFTYTPEKSSVSLAVEGQDDTARLVVRDSGPGIPSEQLERIFDRFYRGDAARDKRAAGAGLGLPIARWIVECHNGKIEAESEIGKGTAITVTLPKVKSALSNDARSASGVVNEPAAVGAQT